MLICVCNTCSHRQNQNWYKWASFCVCFSHILLLLNFWAIKYCRFFGWQTNKKCFNIIRWMGRVRYYYSMNDLLFRAYDVEQNQVSLQAYTRRFLAFELASLLRWKVLSCELVGFKYLMFAISSNSSGEWVLVGSCFEAPMYAIGSWHGTSDAMHGACVIFWKYLKLSDQRLNKSLIESRSFTFFLS